MAAVYPPPHAEIETDERLRALREAQARLRALIENEPECVKLLDAEGRLLEMNAAGLRMIEAERAEDVIGHCVYGLVAPEHVAAFRALTERVCRGERGILEFEMVGLKGARRWLETHAAPFRDEASGETRLLAITRDITERRGAERALRESEALKGAILDASLDAIISIDHEGRIVEFNSAAEKCFGYRRSQAVGKSMAELIVPPELRERHTRGLRRYLATGESRILATHLQMPALRADGTRVDVELAIVRIPGSEPPMFTGTLRDITARKRAEQALRESEQRFQLFMEHAPAAAWIKDAQFRYRYVNRTYEAVYGRGAPEVLGRDDFELHGEARARVFRQEDERIRASGATEQKLHEVPYADGRPGHWLVVKFPLDDGLGGIAIDVTPRLEAEENARRLLQRLVQAQEAERRRVADELHDLIGQNLTALGIDLQALKQRLQSAGDVISAPPIDAMAALVETTVDAIRGVMTDLRPPALEEFGLAPAVRWYASQFGKRTGIKVAMRSEGAERRLAPDTELALFRIMQEALTNAAKHSGGSAVEISLCYAEGLRLTVSDDGRGFAERDGARAAARGGFGLPSMRERAEAIGGQLRVEFPERGTRIVVEVP